ncbi:hypothetical protein HMN09_00863200 [Mycena chlorophos]|uniref:Uncharacterized protein n=1 Tax=Mycena chlorophos TaxID=658473 RepID=A0A8H6STU6_MYCCL|nr:hypothetical protein HMN09_00863200 [Mycena chlorophos]
MENLNVPVSGISLRIAAPGTSKEEFTRRANAFADATLALPAAMGVISKIDLYFPNDLFRDVVESMQLGIPPVCVLIRYEFSSDEARLKLLGIPEFNRLSAEFDPQGTNTAFPVDITTYVDQPGLLGSGKKMTGVSIMNIPTTSNNLAGLAQPAGAFYEKLNPTIAEFLAIPDVQRGLAKYTVMQMSQIHQLPPPAMLESRRNNVLARNQSTIIVITEAADFTEIAQSPAVLGIAKKFRETITGLESMVFAADVTTKTAL